MKKEIVTENFEETRDLGKKLASSLKGGEIICLEGDLGSGKTTFSQGILEGLGAEGSYTSPTFLVMKQYEKKIPNKNQIKNIYHVDTYRVGTEDILNLGWEEITNSKENIVIVEWPERIREILPEICIKIKFESIDENKRRIIF